MASAAIAPFAAAPTAAAPQAHSSGSVPSAESIAAATEQASAPTADNQLKRVAATQDGCNAGLIAKLAKHTGSSKAPDAPTGASFSNDVRKHVRFAQRQQKLAELSTVNAAFDAEDLNDDALLEAARELDEHSSLVEYCCSGLEALCVQAGVYTEELALVSAACTKDMAKEPAGARSMPSSEQGDLPKPRKTVMFADNHDPPFPRWEPSPHLDNVQRLAMNSQQSAWAVAAQVAHAASAIQSSEFRVYISQKRQADQESPHGAAPSERRHQAVTHPNVRMHMCNKSRSPAGAATTLPAEGSPSTRLGSPSYAAAAAQEGSNV